MSVLPPALTAVLTRVAAILLTGALLLLAYTVLMRVIARLLVPRDGETVTSPRLIRLRTVSSLVTNLLRWTLGFIVLVVILGELGVDVQALLVSAGVLGLALGFGAQTLIRDLITGIFLLFEGLIAVGDVVEVDGHRGTVEAIGLRVTKLRALDGSLRVIPNGQLAAFSNLSRGWARAVVDVTLPREVPVEAALVLLRRVGEEWARTSGRALEPPQPQGIIKFNGAETVVRLMAKVPPDRRLDAEYELRRAIKDAFDRESWPSIGAA
jgi:small conductance mechanosensitive channel